MTRKFFFHSFLACFTFLFICRIFVMGKQQNDAAERQENNQLAEAASSLKSKSAKAGDAWGASPFSAATQVDVTALVRRRREKMKALGYATPEKYYQMSLGQLQGLARQGDPHAMVQLAEQYANEVDLIRTDPAFERGAKPKEVAMKYFEGAFIGGYMHLPTVVSMQLAADNDIIGAYAWNLMAQRLSDHANDKVYEQYGTFAKMSTMDKAIAYGKMDTLWLRVVAKAEAQK